MGEYQRGKKCLTVLVIPTDHLPVQHPTSFLIHIEPPRAIRSEMLANLILLISKLENGCLAHFFRIVTWGRTGVSLSRNEARPEDRNGNSRGDLQRPHLPERDLTPLSVADA